MRYKVGVSANKNNSRNKKRSKKKGFKYRKVRKYGVNRKWGSKKKRKGKFAKSDFKKKASKVLGIFLGIVTLFGIGGTIFVGASLASIKRSLPDPNELIERTSDQSTKIYDRGGPDEGVLLYTIYGDQNREFVKLDEVPEHTKWAVLAAEDIEYYDHKGLDITGIMVAAYRNLVKNEVIGASTISQQLVRNTLLYDFLGEAAYERTISRKIKEVLITMQLEQSMSKDEMLQMYLNEVPFGGTSYGIQAASKMYFGKDVSELTLAESATLAGLIQSPGAYSPLFGSQPEMAEKRQEYVLNQMYDNKDYIKKASKKYGKEELELDEEAIEAAKEEEMAYASVEIDIKAPHFVFYVKDKLIEEYGIDRVERGGLIVTTSLDYDIQKIAEEEIKAGVDKYRGAYNVNNGSMVVIDPKTGEIIAMVGSYDYWAEPDPRVDGNVNVATSLRQMGSSVKPYTYLTAFSQGHSPALLTPDIPMDFGYEVKNWDDKYRGLILARQALVESRNIPALYVMDLIGGPDAFIKTAEKLGITTLTQRDRYGLSLTLGAGEMKLTEHVGAFTTFANGGKKADITPIVKIENSKEEDITPEKWKDNELKQVWDEKEIYLLNWTLCDLGGQGRLMSQYYRAGDQKLCGKTGTTDGPRDLTTILYYPNLVVGVWTGNNNNETTIGASGQAWSTTVPLPIAQSFMSRVVPKYGKAWYSRPSGVVSGAVCKDTGLRAGSDTNCSKVSSVFASGHLPPMDNAHIKKPICKETGKVATNEEDAKKLDLIEYKTFLKIKLPQEKYQDDLNKYLRGSKTYGDISSIPEEAVCPLHLGEDNAPVVSFASPHAGDDFEPGDNVTLEVLTTSLNEITKIEFYFDNNLIGQRTSEPYSRTYTIPAGTSIGSHTFTAKLYDSEGNVVQDSVAVNIIDNSSTISVSVSAPTTNETFSMPYTFSATVSGNYSEVQRVRFRLISVSNPDDSFTSGNATNQGSGTWSLEWNEAIDPGDYWVYATVTIPGNSYTSSWVRVSVE